MRFEYANLGDVRCWDIYFGSSTKTHTGFMRGTDEDSNYWRIELWIRGRRLIKIGTIRWLT